MHTTQSNRIVTRLAAVAVEDAGLDIDQIDSLMDASAEAGDSEMAAICQRALSGDSAAIAECARVIADAQQD